ncbi:MAG TPA: hypothetical protein RMH99_09625 [Sandaracinaceae bacterium LLY-WYZ-13_1]|nr:hypothetical protein [Sandaracinaceae bacterium LLY-WYZ-13_1]
MKVWITRAVVLLGLLAVGWVLDALLAPRGLRWIVWTLAAIVLGVFALELILRGRRRRRERADRARWRAAMEDPKARRAAIRELRARIDAARRLGPRLRVRHARLATTLAELHEAEGDGDAAVRVLARVPAEDLEPLQEAVIRLARAQAYLHGGDADGADATLGPLPGTTGEPAVDASLRLARAAVALERGEPDAALAVARDVADRAAAHDALFDEAKALEAACRDARGEPTEARAALDALDETGRRRLRRIGSARVRALLERRTG